MKKKEFHLPETISVKEAVKDKIKLLKKLPKWAWILLASVLLILTVTTCNRITAKKAVNGQVNTATVTYGNISKTIEGEGAVEVDIYQATSLVKGEIIACHIEEGDYVEKDQVLYEIDSGDIENSVKRAENSLKTAQNNYNQTLESVSDLNITSPATGVIQKMYVKNGDQVGNGTPIADVVDSSVMKLKITFLQNDARNMYIGQGAQVCLASTGELLLGTVTNISTGALINADGASVSSVEIQLSNPGALTPGTKATAMVGQYACTDLGEMEYNYSEQITAKQSGKIRNLKFDTADKVYAGSVIANIENTSISNSLESARINLENAQLSLDDMNETLENYKIKSTISGKVIQKNSKLGDKIDNTNSQTVMAIVSDPSELSFQMTVDELDISKIKEGQTAVITADALEGKVFKGHVDKVSEVGTSQNGVTTYPVKIVIDAPENSGIISGMNVNAVINIQSKENVLIVPSSAVQRGNIVYVKGKVAGSEKTEVKMPGFVPEGFSQVKVEIGLSDDNNVEIISGLSEGDIVYVQENASSGNIMNFMGGGHPAGIPGGGGGMSGGGKPSGAGPGGR